MPLNLRELSLFLRDCRSRFGQDDSIWAFEPFGDSFPNSDVKNSISPIARNQSLSDKSPVMGCSR
jgi:hypothetical protein